MRKMPPLNAIRAFEAAARHRSFTTAAKELCVTVTAVSHQIRHLETSLGVKLFERSARAVQLVVAAQRHPGKIARSSPVERGVTMNAKRQACGKQVGNDRLPFTEVRGSKGNLERGGRS
jgi:hypothetical protein